MYIYIYIYIILSKKEGVYLSFVLYREIKFCLSYKIFIKITVFYFNINQMLI